jgi:hypothetical protein
MFGPLALLSPRRGQGERPVVKLLRDLHRTLHSPLRRSSEYSAPLADPLLHDRVGDQVALHEPAPGILPSFAAWIAAGLAYSSRYCSTSYRSAMV